MSDKRCRVTKNGSVSIQERSDGPAKITGYASVFFDGSESSEYRMFDRYVERIAPGAFDRALAEQHDVRGLFNHDPNVPLGRTSAGTMRLSVDSRGLKYEIDAPDTQAARDVLESIRRGDVTGSSFSFVPRIVEHRDEGERHIVEIRDVDLYDVGPVTFPAYQGTEAAARSEDAEQVRRDMEQWEREIAVSLAQYEAEVRRHELAQLT